MAKKEKKMTKYEQGLDNQVQVLTDELYQLKSVIHDLPGSIYWKNKDGVYLGRNRFAAELMYNIGIESEVDVNWIIGKTDFDVFTKKTAEQYRFFDLEVMRTQKMTSREELIYLKSGELVPHISMKRPLYNQKREVVGVIGNSVDITDQKRAEELRFQNKMIEEKMEAMKLLAGTIAHELRTPLMSIHMAADSIKNNIETLIETYEYAIENHWGGKSIPVNKFRLLSQVFSNINREVQYSNLFINMLLMNIQKLEIQEEDLEVGSLQRYLAQAIERYPFVGGQRERLHVDIQTDFQVRLVPLLLEHVVFNLIKNGIYYIEAAGKGDIKIWLETGRVFNKLYFEDRGQGIPEEELKNIFTQFYTKRRKGTGVGLNFCKQVMEQLNGRISCESENGEYTRFVLAFPKVESLG